MPRVVKRGDSWCLFAYLGYDENNVQKVKTKTISANGITKAEAKRIAADFENECRKKTFINERNFTLSDFISYWKEEYALIDENYAPSTLERNDTLLKRIEPALGHILLSKLKPTHLMKFYKNLREDNVRMDGKDGKLSSRTIQMHHKLLSAILNKAKKWQFIEANPCEYVDAPKSSSKTTEIYDEETLTKFIQVLYEKAPIKYKIFFTLAFSTGLRRGELCALTWDNIDEKSNLIYVKKNASIVKGGTITKAPKTEKSAGAVSVANSIFPMLEELKKEQELLKDIYFDNNPNIDENEWNINNNVFINKFGKRHYPSTFMHWLDTFCKNNNLPHITVHAFRHMSVTYALDAGYDLKAVSDRTRHSQLSTTADIYGHYLPKKDAAIAESLNEIIELAKEKIVKSV